MPDLNVAPAVGQDTLPKGLDVVVIVKGIFSASTDDGRVDVHQ